MVQSNRRPPQQQPGRNSATESTAGTGASSATQNASGAQTAPNNLPSTNNHEGQPAGLSFPGRNPAQLTVDINVQIEPIKYEIQMDLTPFSLDNFVFNDLNPTVVNSQASPTQVGEQTYQTDLTHRYSQVGQTGQLYQGVQTSQTYQTNRRHVIGKII